MKLLTLAGQPSCGKTSVILKTIDILQKKGLEVGVCKFDCLKSNDANLFEAAKLIYRVEIAGSVCPDHYFMTKIYEITNWGHENKLDVLIIESAGLCNRCSPHIKKIPAVCVIDYLAGINTPEKIGPMMKYADFIALTKGDLLSQAEREVFIHNILSVNNKARVVSINGLTGQGAFTLADYISAQDELESIEGKHLRFTMPTALCSYCVGQTEIKSNNHEGSRSSFA